MNDRVGQIVRAMNAMQEGGDKYFSYGAIVWDALDSSERDQLRQLLFQGPVWDGCVVSKAARGRLMDYGLAVRCCFKGEQGYTAATYIAYSVHKQGKGTSLPAKNGTEG